MGGFSRAGANGPDLSRAALGCARGTHHSAQANLPDVQRLHHGAAERIAVWVLSPGQLLQRVRASRPAEGREGEAMRSEEHTSELQSPCNLVCRLLLEKKKK